MTARLLAILAIVVCCAGRADAGDHSARRLRRAALAEYQAGDYAAAARDFQASYDLDPDPELLYALGQALRLSGDCAGAVAAYNDFLIRLPDDAQATAAREKIEVCERELTPPAPPPPVTAPSRQTAAPLALPVRRAHPSWVRDPIGGTLLAGGAAAAATGSWLLLDSDRDMAGELLLGSGVGLAAAAVLRYALVRHDRLSDEENLPAVAAGVGPGTLWVSGRF